VREIAQASGTGTDGLSTITVAFKQFGVALAFGVLIDAFLVRMTLVPAILALVGNSAWHLPGWLARRVPDLDVEGEQLIERLEAQAASPPAATPRPERSAEAPPTPE